MVASSLRTYPRCVGFLVPLNHDLKVFTIERFTLSESSAMGSGYEKEISVHSMGV